VIAEGENGERSVRGVHDLPGVPVTVPRPGQQVAIPGQTGANATILRDGLLEGRSLLCRPPPHERRHTERATHTAAEVREIAVFERPRVEVHEGQHEPGSLDVLATSGGTMGLVRHPVRVRVTQGTEVDPVSTTRAVLDHQVRAGGTQL